MTGLDVKNINLYAYNISVYARCGQTSTEAHILQRNHLREVRV